MNNNLSPQMMEAIEELKEIILKEYPEATFNVTEGEDAGSVHLCPTIDVIETDAILDLVMDRVLAFQEEKGLDIHVIPLRTRQREAELQERMRKESLQHPSL
jgi:hypothetical protein